MRGAAQRAGARLPHHVRLSPACGCAHSGRTGLGSLSLSFSFAEKSLFLSFKQSCCRENCSVA